MKNESYYVIYKVTNNLNGKAYIGRHITKKVNDSYMGSGIKIVAAIIALGKHNFTKEVIEYCQTEEELNKREIFYIKKFNTCKTGYNIALGGIGSYGVIPNATTRSKISETIKKHYREHPEARVVISERQKKRTGSKNSFYGRTLTKEHIAKMTKARKKAISGSKHYLARKVKCIETGEVFNTITEAATFCNLKYPTTIVKCCKGTRHTAGGYTWKYVNKEEKELNLDGNKKD